MSRRNVCWLLFAALAVLVLASGCRPKEVTVTDPSGEKVTVVTRKQGVQTKMTITGEDAKGEATTDETGKTSELKITDEKGRTTTTTVTGDVTEADVGIKFYPGATVKSGVKASSSGAEAAGGATVELTTGDSMGDVVAFYKKAYPTAVQTGGEGDSTMIMIGTDNEMKTVLISADGESGGVKILLSAHGLTP